MPTVNEPLERIQRQLIKTERHIARVFAAAVLNLRDSLDLNKLAEALELGDFDGALAMVRDTAERLGQTSALQFIANADETAAWLSSSGVVTVAFDRTNARAVATMRGAALDMVQGFVESQRDVLRTVMTEGIAAGIGPREQARQFRDVVGLTPRQAKAVRNYRRLLEMAGDDQLPKSLRGEALQRQLRDRRFDATIQRAINDGKPIPKAQIDKMVERYNARYIKHRAETIARTEALWAVNGGADEMFQQAYESGKIDPENVTETWRSAGDARVRDSHQHLNGKTKKPGELWQGKISTLRHPGDPLAAAAERINCRCVVTRSLRRPQPLNLWP